MQNREPTAEADAGLKFRLPGLDLVAMFGSAALIMFALIFSISSAVMTPPRDVRLAHDVRPAREANAALPRPPKGAAPVTSAALPASSAVR